MTRLVIPVSHRTLRATGDERLWIDIDLLVRDGAGNWQSQPFRIDNGAQITTYPAYDAKQLGWVVPARPAPVHHPQSGLGVRPGMFRFRIAGMDQTEYAVSCLYLGDPNVPPAPVIRRLLQPLALLNKLRFIMEQDPTGVHK
jgi:hypothetical protein